MGIGLLSPLDRAWLYRTIGWALATALLVGLALAASCGLGGCGHVRPSFGGGMPGIEVPIDDAPARHSDGGQP